MTKQETNREIVYDFIETAIRLKEELESKYEVCGTVTYRFSKTICADSEEEAQSFDDDDLEPDELFNASIQIDEVSLEETSIREVISEDEVDKFLASL